MIQILVQDNYKVALDLGRETFASLDPFRQAERCGCRVLESRQGTTIEVQYIDRPCAVTHPEGKITVSKSREPMSEWEQILVIHYLTSTGPVPEEKEPIVFSQVPSGVFYDSAFQRRVKNHFLSVFGRRPERLVPAAEKLGGGSYGGTGDLAVRIPPFPRINLYFVLWKADEEFPADMNLLMSSNIASFLSTEDIAVLGGIVAGKLIKYSR